MPHGYWIDVPCLAYRTWAISVGTYDEKTDRFTEDVEATEEFGRYLDSRGYSYSKDHTHCR